MGSDLGARDTNTAGGALAPCLPVFNRWFALTAAMFLVLGESVKDTYSLISPEIKEIYRSQTDVNLIASIGLIGGYWALPAGYVCDSFGPGVTMVVGGVLGCFGWFMVRASLLREKEELGLLSVWYFIAVFSVSWFDMAAVVAVNRLFPKSRGHVTGLVKAMAGLGSAVFAFIYNDFVSNNALQYLVVCAIFLPAAALFGSVFIVTEGAESKTVRQESGVIGRLHLYYAVLSVETLYIFVVSSIGTARDIPGFAVAVVVILAILLLGPFVRRPADGTDAPLWSKPTQFVWHAMICGGREDEPPAKEHPQERAATGVAGPVLGDADASSILYVSRYASLDNSDPSAPLLRDDPQCALYRSRSSDYTPASPTLLQSLRHLRFWLVWFAFAINTGLGFMVSTNLSQIERSLRLHNPTKFSASHYSQKDVSNVTELVALYSVGNALARLAMGYGSSWYSMRYDGGEAHWGARTKMSRAAPRKLWAVCVVSCALVVVFASAPSINDLASCVDAVCYVVNELVRCVPLADARSCAATRALARSSHRAPKSAKKSWACLHS